MSDAFDYFRAYAVRALCKARAMPRGRGKHLQILAGRIYHLLTKEAAYRSNVHRLDDFRAARKLEKSLENRPNLKQPIDIQAPSGSKIGYTSSSAGMSDSGGLVGR